MSFSANSKGLTSSGRVKVVAGYALQERLGSGSFAVVYKAVKVNSEAGDETVAVKAIARTSDKLTPKVLQNLEIEISILRTYRHTNIVCMHNVLKTERHFYLLLEYCAGGDVQGLIRSRRVGRLSERLTRRLMKGLCAGLKFLWGQELIHRDIKPQNLLLTGCLPLDELDDPCLTPQQEEERRRINFPSEKFKIKIADFGFARHLQSTSLAETLCGSPIYMAPEILQHQRCVVVCVNRWISLLCLFLTVPPIVILRYDAKADLWSVGTVLFEMIAGKPPFNGENHIDLLRNIQRKAVRLPPDVRVSPECVTLLRILLNRNPLARAGFEQFYGACDDLVALGCNGVFHADPGSCSPPARDLNTIPEATGACTTSVDGASLMTVATQVRPQVSPQLGSAMVPTVPLQLHKPPPLNRGHLTPLVPSPPVSRFATLPPEPPKLDLALPSVKPAQVQMVETPSSRGNDAALQQSSGGEGDSFVMVESFPDPPSSAGLFGAMPNATKIQQAAVIPTSTLPTGLASNDIHVLSNAPGYSMKGMLSTSPGTGGALMGMVTGSNRIVRQDRNDQIELRLRNTSKLLAASEDVGRRAVSVAHLGDNRVYMAMKLTVMNESSSSSLQVSKMDGIEEDSGTVTDDSAAGSARRRSSMASMPDTVEEEDEMPFALQTDSSPLQLNAASIPSRRAAGSSNPSLVGSRKQSKPATPSAVHSSFCDALACYIKALGMLKGSVGASTNVAQEIESIKNVALTPDQHKQVQQLQTRSEVISQWLGGQFRGVLDRAEATSAELAKLSTTDSDRTTDLAPKCAEEIIYNHSLAFGREGAVKQLLGQHEAARACYRSAGLLAETLLMENKLDKDDRMLLETYVDGFATRIIELDESILQHSRMSNSSSVRRSVVGLVGGSSSALHFH